MIRIGDILVFKRNPKDKVSGFLSWILQRFEPSYTREYWHTAPVTGLIGPGCWVLGARRGGAREDFYTLDYIEKNCRVFYWLDKVYPEEVDRFVTQYEGVEYDAGAYFGTVIAYLWAKITRNHWRIVDTQLHCWELTCLFCRKFGKPLQPMNEYPLISTMLRALEGREHNSDMAPGESLSDYHQDWKEE